MLVISDIHGNLTFFKALLRQVGFCADDIPHPSWGRAGEGAWTVWPLCGHVMSLREHYEVHMLCGNCDNLTFHFVDQTPDIPPEF